MAFKKQIVFLIVVTSTASSFSGKDAGWSADDYVRHSFRTFTRLAAIRQRIDFTKIDYPLLHAAIFYQTNLARQRYNRPLLEHLPALEHTAFEHSQDMVRYDFFSHHSPVSGKHTLRERVFASGLVLPTLGENIANVSGLEYQSGRPVFTPPRNGGYFSYAPNGPPLKNRTYLDLAIIVVDELMGSRGHRENILDPRFKYLGTGAAFFKEKKFYDMPYFKVTQVFAGE